MEVFSLLIGRCRRVSHKAEGDLLECAISRRICTAAVSAVTCGCSCVCMLLLLHGALAVTVAHSCCSCRDVALCVLLTMANCSWSIFALNFQMKWLAIFLQGACGWRAESWPCKSQSLGSLSKHLLLGPRDHGGEHDRQSRSDSGVGNWFLYSVTAYDTV